MRDISRFVKLIERGLINAKAMVTKKQHSLRRNRLIRAPLTGPSSLESSSSVEV